MLTAEDVRSIALSLPGSHQQAHFHKTSFRIKNKIFCTLDEAQQVAVLKLTPEQQSVYTCIKRRLICGSKWHMG